MLKPTVPKASTTVCGGGKAGRASSSCSCFGARRCMVTSTATPSGSRLMVFDATTQALFLKSAHHPENVRIWFFLANICVPLYARPS